MKFLARSLAALALAGGFVAAATAPAAAAPDCYIIKYIGIGNGFVFAENETYCESTGQSTPRYVEIKRQNPDGTLTTIASGMGSAEYTCTGTATTTYWTNGSGLPRDRARSVTGACS